MGYEKWVSIRERNIKLLFENVIYIPIIETLACISTIETVMCIMHCRKYHLHNLTETPTCIITTKSFPHIFVTETSTCMRPQNLYNFFSYFIYSRFFIAVAYHTVANLARLGISVRCNSSRRCHLHNCYRKHQFYSSNKNYHLQNRVAAFTCIDVASQAFL